MLIKAWKPEICLECLCCNQSQARSSHHMQATNGFLAVTEQVIFVLFNITSYLIRNLNHRRYDIPHEQCWGPHPSHLAILERKILEENATTTSVHVRTCHMKTVKVKNRDVFISDSRIPANIFVEQGDCIYCMWANDWTFELLCRQKLLNCMIGKLERSPTKSNMYGAK